MSGDLYQEQVNLKGQKPTPPNPLPGVDSCVVIGDLHGNSLKFLFFLIKEGVIDLPEQRYQQFQQLYYDEDIDEQLASGEDLDELFECIDEMVDIINEAEVISTAKVRLIGDELADRGNNDLFTLLLMKKLADNNVPLSIAASNHSIEYVTAYENIGGNVSEAKLEAPTYTGEWEPFGKSLANMQRTLDHFPKYREMVQDITETVYIPNMRLIDYDIDQDGNIHISTHAPIGFEKSDEAGMTTVKRIVGYLNDKYYDNNYPLEFNVDDVGSFAYVLDAINDAVRDMAEHYEMSKYF